MTGKHIDSYDRLAPRPVPGTLWVWEPDRALATALIRVTAVLWNGEEWWVATRALADYSMMPKKPDPPEAWNDLSRFWEASHYVLRFPGVPRMKGVTRRGEPCADEIREQEEAGR